MRSWSGGTFFEDVPGGGDAYLLKFILHDWDDADLTDHFAENADEHVRRTQNFWSWSRLLDRPTKGWRPNSPTFRCWWGMGGEERTEEEFATLFAAAGFRLEKIIAADPSAMYP